MKKILSVEAVRALAERSKFDNELIVGSEIRALAQSNEALRQQRDELLKQNEELLGLIAGYRSDINTLNTALRDREEGK